MASENVATERVSTTVSESLDEWLEERVESAGFDREELLRQLLAAYREATETGDGSVEAIVKSETARLAEKQETLEAEYREDLADVRERVVQVKRETDEKAPASHDHSDLREQATVAAAEADALQESVEDLHSRVERGFDNYEEILEYLTETTDELETKVDTLAEAMLDVKERVESRDGRRAAREATDELATEANRLGVRTGNCEECGQSVDVALLSAPNCPHCASTFSGIEKNQGLSGLFGTSTLRVGDRPALDGAVADDAPDSGVTDKESESLPTEEQ